MVSAWNYVKFKINSIIWILEKETEERFSAFRVRYNIIYRTFEIKFMYKSAWN